MQVGSLLLWLGVMLLSGPLAVADVVGRPAAIRLTLPSNVAPQVEAFPRIAVPQDAQIPRINQALTAADARVLSSVQDCHAQLAPAGGDVKDGGWTRAIRVAMRGPRFLAMEALDSWYCGGSYPSTDNFVLAYDLRTGSPLNWERLLPKALMQSATLDTAGDGTSLGVVASPKLTELCMQYAKLDPDCTAALHDTGLQFMLWPDAGHDGIAIGPTGLPHVIPLSVARGLGVSPGLLDAIDAAHKAGLFGFGTAARRKATR
jgi:hypothetical protein